MQRQFLCCWSFIDLVWEWVAEVDSRVLAIYCVKIECFILLGWGRIG